MNFSLFRSGALQGGQNRNIESLTANAKSGKFQYFHAEIGVGQGANLDGALRNLKKLALSEDVFMRVRFHREHLKRQHLKKIHDKEIRRKRNLPPPPTWTDIHGDLERHPFVDFYPQEMDVDAQRNQLDDVLERNMLFEDTKKQFRGQQGGRGRGAPQRQQFSERQGIAPRGGPRMAQPGQTSQPPPAPPSPQPPQE